MEAKLCLLSARLDWCQRLRTVAGTQEGKEGWLAEEEGLRDALHGRERVHLVRLCYPSQVERYRLGFDDGQTLLYLSPSSTMRRLFIGGVGPSLPSQESSPDYLPHDDLFTL